MKQEREPRGEFLMKYTKFFNNLEIDINNKIITIPKSIIASSWYICGLESTEMSPEKPQDRESHNNYLKEQIGKALQSSNLEKLIEKRKLKIQSAQFIVTIRKKNKKYLVSRLELRSDDIYRNSEPP